MNKNIKKRHNKSLYLTSNNFLNHRGNNIYAEGSKLNLPKVNNSLGFGNNKPGLAGLNKRMNVQQTPNPNAKTKGSSSFGLGGNTDLAGAISGVTSGVTGMLDAFNNNSQIADTTEIESNIDNVKNAEFDNYTNTDSLIDSFSNQMALKTDYTGKDIRGLSVGEGIGNTLSAVGSGASAGASVGGPWGAVVGGVVGLGSAIAGIFTGKKKAENKAEELNRLALNAERTANINFQNQLGEIQDLQHQNNMANLAAYGGRLYNKNYYDNGGPFNYNLGEGFLYDSSTDTTNTTSPTVSYTNEKQNKSREYTEGYTPRNTPVSGLFGDKHSDYADLAWGAAEMVPVVGNIMGIADVVNDIRNLYHDKHIDSGDIGNLILDLSGLVPGISTFTKGAKVAKLAKLNKFSSILENIGNAIKQASPDGVKEIKKRLLDIIDFNEKAADSATKAALSRTTKEAYKASMQAREASKMSKGILERVDKALNPRAVQYRTLQETLNAMDAANDGFGFVGNIEDNINKKEFGGTMNTHGGYFSNNIIKVDKGGTHEENPYEGVPMGISKDGNPNLVEEGEVIFKDYVFSNRLHLNKKELKEAGLPSKYDKHTFALAAEDISKESSERPNDPISKNGLNAMLGRLAGAQELQRMKKGKQGTQQMMAYGGHKFDGKTDTLLNSTLNDLAENTIIPEERFSIQDSPITLASTDPYFVPYMSKKGKSKNKGVWVDDRGNVKGRKGGNPHDKIPFDYLRLAPIVGSTIGSINSVLSKPNHENAEILKNAADNVGTSRVTPYIRDRYLTYTPVDKEKTFNKLQNQLAANREAIMRSGANPASVTAGLLAADASSKEALMDAAYKGDLLNQQLKQSVYGANKQADLSKAQLLMGADSINAQLGLREEALRSGYLLPYSSMREASDTAHNVSKTANLTTLFDNIGAYADDSYNRRIMKNLLESGYFNTGAEKIIAKNGGMLTKRNRRKK